MNPHSQPTSSARSPRLAPRVSLAALSLGLLCGLQPTAAASAPVQDAWTALELPRITESPPRPSNGLLRPVQDGRFVRPADEPVQRESLGPAAAEPATVLGLLQAHAALRGLDVEFHSAVPPLLARGPAEALEELRSVLRGLDAFSSALEIELEVWIGPAAQSTGSGGGEFPAVAARDADHHASVRSGSRVSLGSRKAAAFLTGYNVEVATDSGVADPVTSHAQLGRVVHLTASRVQGGAAVHLSGWLEVSALVDEPAAFDPDTPDLGEFEQPEVRVAQVVFSDVVASGGHTHVTVAGTVDGWADLTVWIRATTSADPLSGGDPALWEGLDLALFEQRSEVLAQPSPGYGAPRLRGSADPEPPLAQAFGAAQVAAASAAGGRGRPSPVWSRGLLLVPGGGPEASAARGLVDTLEAGRLVTRRLHLARGTLRVDLPVAGAQPLRVLYGTERVRVVDYEAHIAAESWMPVPTVERLFDGVCAQGHLAPDSERLLGFAWVAETPAIRTLDRAAVGMGKLQLPERSFEQGTFALHAGDPRARWSLRSDAPGLTLEVKTP